MSFSGSQGTDLQQAPRDALVGSYEFLLEREGVWLQDSSEGSINIPWILSVALMEGNAATKALGETANIFPEPEWGWDTGLPGRDIGPGQQMWMGGAVGGFIRSW
jgi:hypothetical protein